MTTVDTWEMTMRENEKRRFRAPEAAAYIHLSPSTLAKMRMRGDGPPYMKAGPRVVIYDQDDLDAWLAARSRRSTSQLADDQ
jgi:predicted DNA-binding transcriptional regulator AlpA